MSLQSELTDLTTNLAAAKAAVVTKGGTVGNTGLAGLENEILSIPTQRVLPWGEITYYSVYTPDTATTVTLENLTIVDATSEALVNFIKQRLYVHSSPAQIEAYYWLDSGTLKCSWNDGSGNWRQFNVAELENYYHVTVSLINTNTNGHWVLTYADASVDKTSQVLALELSSQSEYESLATQNNDFSTMVTIGSTTFMWGAIKKFEFGKNPTTMPNNFLYCSGVEEVDFSHAKITSIGNSCLYQCTSLDGEIALPDTLTTIGDSFLSGCSKLDFPVLGKSVTTIGSYCLYSCSKFNSRVVFPALTSVGSDFMQFCSVFNHDISFPALTTVGGYFLATCSKFNSTVSLPELTTITGGHFMETCQVFNQPLSLPKVTDVGNAFLSQCTAFNSTVSLPAVVTIGNEFMRQCTNFNTAFTLPSTLRSIGNLFLCNDSSFNKAVTIPSGTTSIGSTFIGECSSFNKAVTFPSTLTSIGTHILWNSYAMTATVTCNCAATVAATSDYTFATSSSTAASYTTGITISGTYASAWKSRFPNRTSNPYRKLV